MQRCILDHPCFHPPFLSCGAKGKGLKEVSKDGVEGGRRAHRLQRLQALFVQLADAVERVPDRLKVAKGP